MKRTVSTAKTRGKVTRIISVTRAVVKAYNIKSDCIDELEIDIPGTVSERKAIHAIYNGGFLSKADYTILSVKSVETTGTLYAMDLEKFIAHAEIIENGITND